MPDTNATFDRRSFLGLMAAGVTGAAVSGYAASRAAAAQSRRLPNFVIIFTDDQGYNDLGCFGSPDIKTPNIDRMAAEGMKFTDFYVAAPVCTPSRAALMTGCYPQRVGLGTGVLFPNHTRGLHPDEITVADLLKSRGYATACVGKWHLGHLPEFLPMKQGFDSYYGIPYSNDMNPSVLLRNETVIEMPAVQHALTERYTQEALNFIKANRDQPFFLYLAHTMPHTPLAVSAKFAGKSDRGLYGDVIECIDWSTGQILDQLKKQGIDGDTLVIYTSDNGPWLIRGYDGGSAEPLREGKGTTFDGGQRVPCVMRWPGHIPAGTVCSEVATTMDILPTFAGLVDVPVPSDRIIDGKDIWPLMEGQSGAQTPHDAFFYYRNDRLEAVRSGDWKLAFERPARQGPANKLLPYQLAYGAPEGVPEALYNLRKDIGETRNVIDKHPDIAARLRELAERCREDLGDSRTGQEGKNRRPAGVVPEAETE